MKDNLQNDRARLWAYVLIALAALLAGFVLGQLGQDTSSRGSRIDWPHPVR